MMAEQRDEWTISSKEALMVDLAAHGDADAQLRLARYCLDASEETPEDDNALPMAELAARMASAHGAAEHRLFLAFVLNARAIRYQAGGDAGLAGAYQAEALAILNELADEGDEEAARQLITLVEGTDPRIVVCARRMRRKVTPGMPSVAAPFGITASELRSLKG